MELKMQTVSPSGQLEPHPNNRLKIVYRRIEEVADAA
jgi:hypothetical protein